MGWFLPFFEDESSADKSIRKGCTFLIKNRHVSAVRSSIKHWNCYPTVSRQWGNLRTYFANTSGVIFIITTLIRLFYSCRFYGLSIKTFDFEYICRKRRTILMNTLSFPGYQLFSQKNFCLDIRVYHIVLGAIYFCN